MTTSTLRADLVLRSATVLTMDPADTRARAVAVRDGIIVGVGADHDVESLIGPGTRVIDGRGKTVTPGFIDSHTHNVFVGEFRYRLDQLNLPAQLTPTVEALLAQVKARAARTPAGTWIGGKNVEPNGMQERRWPNRHELDRVAPHHPVVLTIRGGHACVANTRALDLFGIGQDTPDPEGGVIDRDPATGDLTGVLRDVTTIRSALPQATVGELKDGLATLEKMFLRLGITSTHDCGAGARPEPYRAYGEAVAERRWRIRTSFFVYHDFLMANEGLFREGFDDQLKLRGVKLFMDGSIQCFTCAFREPYVTRDTRGWEGLRYSQDKVDEAVMEAHRRGYQVAIHAQGDYGITMAVNAIERAMQAAPRPDPRHRIEHTLCPTLDDLQRMQRLGITPNFFLFHPWFWGDQHINEFIGPARARGMVPARTAIDLGMRPCAHSDCPVCTPDDPVWPSNPLWGMACAVTRRTQSGVDIGAAERVTPLEALRIYTASGARAAFEEGVTGSIEVGKRADLVMLAENPLEVDPWAIKDITVERTILGGEIAYDCERDG